MPNAFSDAVKITKSHIPTVNAPARIEILEGPIAVNECKARQKRGRPIGSKDLTSGKRKFNEKSSIDKPLEEAINDPIDHLNKNFNSPKNVDGIIIPEEIVEASKNKTVPNNNEIPISYMNYGEM